MGIGLLREAILRYYVTLSGVAFCPFFFLNDPPPPEIYPLPLPAALPISRRSLPDPRRGAAVPALYPLRPPRPAAPARRSGDAARRRGPVHRRPDASSERAGEQAVRAAEAGGGRTDRRCAGGGAGDVLMRNAKYRMRNVSVGVVPHDTHPYTPHSAFRTRFTPP